MPNIKSAKKRLRTSEESRQRNMAVRTRVKTQRREFMEASAADDKKTAEASYKTYCSTLDNAAKHGVIKKNTAARRKARAADQLRALK